MSSVLRTPGSRLRTLAGAPGPVPPASEAAPRAQSFQKRLSEDFYGLPIPWMPQRFDTSDGFGWGLANGSISDRRGGRDMPLFWSEIDLRGYRVLSRHICDSNPFGKGFSRLLTNYHVRKGYSWQACRKGKKKGAYQTVDSEPDELLTKAQTILDRWQSENLWKVKSRESFLRARRDGEVFLRFFSRGWKQLSEVRFVDPSQVGNPSGQTDGPESYGIAKPPGDVAGPNLAFHLWSVEEPGKGEWVDGAQILHARCNVDSDVKRGLPDFFPVAELLDNASALLKTMMATALKQARVAWREKSMTWSQEQAQGLRPTVPSGPGGIQGSGPVAGPNYGVNTPYGPGYPGTGYGLFGNGFRRADVVRVEGGREFEPGPTFAGAEQYIAVEQACLRGCGTVWNFPEYFSGDASNNNMASSFVANAPFVVAVECEQEVWGEQWERPVALHALLDARDMGLLTYAEWAQLDVEVKAANVATADPAKDYQTVSAQIRDKVISLDTARQKSGLDPQHEAEGVKKDAASQAPPQGPGPPPGPGGAPGDGSGGGAGGPPKPVPTLEARDWLEEYTNAEYALLAEAGYDRSHLVFDQQKKRWVNPNKGQQDAERAARAAAFKAAHGGRTPREHLEHLKAQAEPKRQAARELLAKAQAAPHTIGAKEVPALAAALDTLTRDELREHARAVRAKLGGAKKELVDRLLKAVGVPTDEERRATLETRIKELGLSPEEANGMRKAAGLGEVPAPAPKPEPEPEPVPKSGAAPEAPAVSALAADPGADRAHVQALVDALPEGTTRDYLDSALHNMARPTRDLEPGARRRQTVDRLAAAWRDAHAAGATATADHLLGVLRQFGADTHGPGPGDNAAFDGRYHDSEHSAFTGDGVTVKRQPVVLPQEGGGHYVAVKGAVGPAPSAPAKSRADTAAEITAKRKARRGQRTGADDAKPSPEEVAAAGTGAAKPVPAPPGGRAVSLDDPAALAAAVHDAARHVPSFVGARYAPGPAWDRHKVFISSLFDHMEKAGTLPKETTIDQFKTALLAANRAGTLTLTRNDLPQVVPDELRPQINRSETNYSTPYLNAQFHAVSAPVSAPAPAAASTGGKSDASSSSSLDKGKGSSNTTPVAKNPTGGANVDRSEQLAAIQRHADGAESPALKNALVGIVKHADGRDIAADLKYHYLDLSDAAPAAAAEMKPLFAQLGMAPPITRQDRAPVSKVISAANLTPQWDEERQTLFVQTHNPKTGNRVVVPVKALTPEAAQAAIGEAKKELARRDKEATARKRAQQQVDSE